MARFVHNPLSLSINNDAFHSWVAESNGEAVAAAASAGAAARRPSRPKHVPERAHATLRAARAQRRRASARAERTARARGAAGGGRSLALLRVDDLVKKARPWREFVGGSTPVKEFSVPRSVEDASFKLSENVYEFIGNYLIVALICVCCVLYKRPVALVGILITSKAWDWLRFQEGGADDVGNTGAAGASPPARGRRPPDAADAPPPQRRTPSRISQLKQLAVTIFTWAVLMFSQVVPAMILAALFTLIVVLIHGLLRNPVPPLRGRRSR